MDVRSVAAFESFILESGDLHAIGIDIPVILEHRPTRRADSEARSVLGPRRSSVFASPQPDVIEQATYAEARRVSRDRHGIGLSAQSYALRTRILEVQPHAAHDQRIIEVHPEVTFATMAGEPLPFAKKTWNGQMMRRNLLRDEGLELDDTLASDAGDVPPDDMLDAAAAAWTAARYALGAAVSYPTDPSHREGVIWA